MLHLLLIVEHEPALGAENLSVGFGLDVLDLKHKIFPLFTILFNHLLLIRDCTTTAFKVNQY
jgi:hypothetical protein